MALSLAAGRPGSSLAGGLLSARAQWKCGSAFAQLAWDQDQWKEITDWGLLGRASPIATAPPPPRPPHPPPGGAWGGGGGSWLKPLL